MKTRRGFFGAFAGVAAAAVGLTHGTSTEPSAAALDMDELRAAFNRLRAEMEKPIEVSIVLDGRKIARQTIEAIPSMLGR